MKLAIITALHERYRLTRLFLRYYHELEVPGVELVLCCAVTRDEYRMHELVRDFPAWRVVYADNSPLTRKFAANMASVPRDVDALLVLGSDDFVSAGYILDGMEKVQETGFAGTPSLYYLDLGTENMIYQFSIDDRPVGAGRFLSNALLQSLDWMPWNMENPRLDAALLDVVGVPCTRLEVGTLLDVKVRDSYGRETNQTPYATVRSWPHLQVDARRYMRQYFPQLEKELLP